MNRRKMFAAAAAPLALVGAASEAPNSMDKGGFIVLHVDCGKISPDRAHAFGQRIKDEFSNHPRRPKNWTFIVRLNRMQGNSVEVHPLGSPDEAIDFFSLTNVGQTCYGMYLEEFKRAERLRQKCNSLSEENARLKDALTLRGWGNVIDEVINV